MRVIDGSRGWRAAGLGAAVAASYVLAATLGFRFAVVAEQVTTVWAPSGIGMGALLLWGPSLWPAVWLGAFLVNASFDVPLWAAAAIASGNTLEAVAGATAMRRIPRFDARLARIADATSFILLGASAATAVGATIGVATLTASGLQPWARFGELWRAWWLGDAAGVLLVGPLLLTSAGWRRSARGERVEGGLLVAATALVAQVVFGTVSGAAHHPLEFVIFPFVIVAAMRSGQKLTALVVFVASAVAITNTARGAGPFAGPLLHESLILLQVFMAVLAGTGLLLAAAVAERETGERRRMAAARVGQILASAPDLRAAAPAVLSTICGTLDWQAGGLWLVDAARGRLACFDVWTEQDPDPSAFVRMSRELSFEPGVGLPGRVWSSRRPTWIADLGHDPNFPRAAVARHAGLHGAVAFPVLLGDECLGVFEFFNRTVVPPDTDLLQTMATVGNQVGQFVGRKREETAARQAEGERERLLALEAAARGEAEAANRAKDEFLATLSHELRTPLNAIVGWTRILSEGLLDERNARHALEVIERNANLQAQLVDDILDVSRIVTGKVRLDLRPVEIQAVAGAALEAVGPMAAARKVRLQARLPAPPLLVLGDADRLQQIIWNLLTNAVKFSETGGAVELDLASGDDAVRIRVVDEGAGIDPAFLPHVFERFTQADGSLSRRHGGLGLGLAIVRHLVELHGGRVAAESAGHGRGAAFTVDLPRLMLAAGDHAGREATS